MRVVLLLLLFHVLLPLKAQHSAPWSLGTRAYGGFLAPHHKSVWIMVDRHAVAGELFLQRPFSGAKKWHAHYVHPRWGLSLLAMDPGSTRAGAAVRLLPYLELPLIAPGHWELNTRIGWGLGLVQNPFQRVDNFKQHAIGGHLNLAAQWAFSVRRNWGRNALDLGISLDHLSNGSMQQPNLGINVASLALGYMWNTGAPAPLPAMPDTTWSRTSRTEVLVMGNVGWTEVYPLESGRRSVFSASASVVRRITAKSAVSGGLDLFNKGTVPVMDEQLADRPRLAYTQAGIHAGYAMLFGAMTLYMDVGTYLHTPVEERAPVFTRVGMRHRVGERLFANFTLKSHFFVADHFEVGLGYRIR